MQYIPLAKACSRLAISCNFTANLLFKNTQYTQFERPFNTLEQYLTITENR